MVAPPVFDGVFQERSIRVWPLAVAVSAVGAPGAVAAGGELVVAFATFDTAPVPAELIAETR